MKTGCRTQCILRGNPNLPCPELNKSLIQKLIVLFLFICVSSFQYVANTFTNVWHLICSANSITLFYHLLLSYYAFVWALKYACKAYLTINFRFIDIVVRWWAAVYVLTMNVELRLIETCIYLTVDNMK